MPDLSSITGDIAIIGAGNMGGAILAGLLQAGMPPTRVRVCEVSRANQLTQQYGVTPTSSAAQAARGASAIIVAVKPHQVRDVVKQMAAQLQPGTLLISIAAGLSCRDIEAWAQTPQNPTPAVVRAMPNTPARLRHGATAIARGTYARDSQMMAAQVIFGAIGAVTPVEESQMAAVSAVSGCGPAYLFLVAEAMTDAAVMLGLPRGIAAKLVAQTFVGSSALLATDESPTELRAQVTSPGGTTAAAVFELEDRGVRAAFGAAMRASVDRSNQLG